MMNPFRSLTERLSLRVVFALFALYIIWGSTYLGIRIGLNSFPPFLMAGLRFLIAGSTLYVFLRV
ncbi:MAG: drug/metabolite exporter YedA, partial [Chloroflexota bacterium]